MSHRFAECVSTGSPMGNFLSQFPFQSGLGVNPFSTVYVPTTIIQFNLMCYGNGNVMGRLWEAFVYVNILCTTMR